MSTEGERPDVEPVAPAPPAPLMDMLDLDSEAEVVEPDVVLERLGHTVTLTIADDAAVDRQGLCEAAIAVLIGETSRKGQLDLHLVDIDTMAELNLAHMHSDEPTDVLAFPLDSDEFDAAAGGDRPALIGDVVISPAVAFAQAPGHTGSFEAEMLLLVIHGVLHVLGHDHGETEERLQMQQRERHYLAGLDFHHPVPAP